MTRVRGEFALMPQLGFGTGMNGGWIQIAGPQNRFFDFKDIEVNEFGGALQQVRFPPTRLAKSPGDARTHLFMLPGATYINPELSWKYESGPAGTTFVRGSALGVENEGTLWIGSARAFSQVGGTGGPYVVLRLVRGEFPLMPQLGFGIAPDSVSATEAIG
jgi:aldose sugar dehydrogenase